MKILSFNCLYKTWPLFHVSICGVENCIRRQIFEKWICWVHIFVDFSVEIARKKKAKMKVPIKFQHDYGVDNLGATQKSFI